MLLIHKIQYVISHVFMLRVIIYYYKLYNLKTDKGI